MNHENPLVRHAWRRLYVWSWMMILQQRSVYPIVWCWSTELAAKDPESEEGDK